MICRSSLRLAAAAHPDLGVWWNTLYKGNEFVLAQISDIEYQGDVGIEE